MTCPNCSKSLTEAQIKHIWASYCLWKRQRAARKASCSCGTCRKCKNRAAMRERRKLSE